MFAIVLGKYIYRKKTVILSFISNLVVNVKFNSTEGNVSYLLELAPRRLLNFSLLKFSRNCIIYGIIIFRTKLTE